MKAIELQTAGAPLRLVERPRPHVRADGVLIQVKAAPVLSYMQRVVSGELPYMLPEGPFIPGSDVIGIVEAIGSDVVDLEPGTLVHAGPQIKSRGRSVEDDSILIGLTGTAPRSKRVQNRWKDGAFAEVAHYPVDGVTPLDAAAHVGVERLAALPFLAVTYGGLLAAALEPGEIVIIGGATGNFGAHAVLVALAMGAGRVVPTGRRQRALEELRSIDSDRISPAVLTGDIEADTRTIQEAAGRPAGAFLDILGGGGTAPVLASLRALERGGRAVLMGALAEPIQIPYVELMVRGLTVRGNFMYPPEAVGRIVAMIAAKTLALDALEVESFPLDAVHAALAGAAEKKGLNFSVLSP